MKSTRVFPESVLVVFLLCSICSVSSSEHSIPCIAEERQALLNVKQQLHSIPCISCIGGDDLLSSWGNEYEKRDCCKWLGIQCDNHSGHVVSLDLSPSKRLGGTISPSLFGLRYLTYLNFQFIDFNGSRIPSAFGTLGHLRHLILSRARLSGEIPRQLANLSRLEELDLGGNYGLTIKNLKWLTQFSSLKILDLSSSDLSRATDWLQRVKQLPSLTTLRLGSCSLPNTNDSLTSLSFVNSSRSLEDLDLSTNHLSGPIFSWLFNWSNSLANLDLSWNLIQGSIPEAFSNMTSLIYLDLRFNILNGSIPKVFSKMNALTHLDLSYNELHGSIPKRFGNMTALEYVDLASNKLRGSIPEDFSKMNALTQLDLSYNELCGSVPDIFRNMSDLSTLNVEYNMLEGGFPRSIFNASSLSELRVGSNNLRGHIPQVMSQLKQLEAFDVSRNSFKGEVSEAHFLNLSRLDILDLSSNSLTLNFHSNWTPPFRLIAIGLGSCKLGPQFPNWLQTQRGYYADINLSNSGISDSIPDWFWDISLGIVDLSNNQFRGRIGNNVSNRQTINSDLTKINLSSNKFEGPIPSFLFRMSFLNLSKNRFSKLNLICNITNDVPLRFLDISNNELSEELPDCWSHFKSLQILILTNNKLSGRIPSSIGSLRYIVSLKLNDNQFLGELPSTVKNCTDLVVIDLGENYLSGMIPSWLGTNLSYLSILSLRSNRFYGSMSNSLCHLSSLLLLDLSLNLFEGQIPKCIRNFTAMREGLDKDTGNTGTSISFESLGFQFSYGGIGFSTSYNEEVLLVWKGKVEEFKSTLALVRSIDLSSNKLVGEIPRELTELSELVSLNLSRNMLRGHIPPEIGRMKSLDALDLSWNHLIGEIPSSLAQIDRLNTLDLSNNNLSGQIPIGTQLQSFEAASFAANPELCGAPLPKNCSNPKQTTPRASDEEYSDDLLSSGFYISMAVGFIVAFWGVCAMLIFNKSFRYAYFKLSNDIGDRLYVATAIQGAKLKRMIKG